MRALYQHIRLPDSSSLKCLRACGEHFTAKWHFHPEIELKLVEHSHGLRFVGDSVEPFQAGDLVLVGPDLPHYWLNPTGTFPRDNARGIIVQFKQDFLGADFWRVPEFTAVAALLERSQQGIQFSGPDVQAAIEGLYQLAEAAGMQRIFLLLGVLDRLAHARGQRLLSSAGYKPAVRKLDANRINLAHGYVHEHVADEISLPKVAALVRMTPNAFCRFYRQKTGGTFATYVNQVRVANALHLIVEGKMNISEACFASGFNDLSNFNRRFRAIKGMSPRDYLQTFYKKTA